MYLLRQPAPVGTLLTDEQVEALAVSPDALAKLEPRERLELALRHAELKNAKHDRFWNALTAIATGGIPLLVAFGLLRGR